MSQVQQIKNNCRSWRSPSPLYHTDCSDPIIVHKKWAYNEDHEQVLVETGKENVWEKIQSYEDETGVYNVLKICQQRGESLDRLDASHGQGFYGDVSDMPDNIHDLHAQGIKSSSMLDEYNKILGTSYTSEQLLAAFADGSLAALLNSKFASKQEDPKPTKEGDPE